MKKSKRNWGIADRSLPESLGNLRDRVNQSTLVKGIRHLKENNPDETDKKNKEMRPERKDMEIFRFERKEPVKRNLRRYGEWDDVKVQLEEIKQDPLLPALLELSAIRNHRAYVEPLLRRDKNLSLTTIEQRARATERLKRELQEAKDRAREKSTERRSRSIGRMGNRNVRSHSQVPTSFWERNPQYEDADLCAEYHRIALTPYPTEDSKVLRRAEVERNLTRIRAKKLLTEEQIEIHPQPKSEGERMTMSEPLKLEDNKGTQNPLRYSQSLKGSSDLSAKILSIPPPKPNRFEIDRFRHSIQPSVKPQLEKKDEKVQLEIKINTLQDQVQELEETVRRMELKIQLMCEARWTACRGCETKNGQKNGYDTPRPITQ